MGWLIGPTLAAFFAAFIVIKLFDYVFSGVTDTLGSVARAGVFIVTCTAVMVNFGMRGFTSKVRQLRQGNAKAIKALSKGIRTLGGGIR